MIRSLICLTVMGCLMTRAASAQSTQPATGDAGAANVPVKVVVLYSSGVGYFEHLGSVQNDARTELRFKTEQINDILKSLVLQDLDGGRVTTITYPSQDPLEKTLKSFQVDIAKNPTLAELLNQLRGAQVTIQTSEGIVEGSILGVEKKQVAAPDNKAVVERGVLNVLSGAMIRAIPLDDVRNLKLTDARLEQELHKALAALAQARDQDKKPVVVNFTGQGERRVRIGYVIETPIWKTSYRLILPDKPEDKAKLQGWAIVENQTDNDWDNVQLGLVSGRPISFVQDLYRSLYIPRPVVQPELYASLQPQLYQEGIVLRQDVAAAPAAPADKQRRAAKELRGAAAAEAQNGAVMQQKMAQQLQEDKDSASRFAYESVASMASAADLGELFQYTVPNVSLPRQRSAMIPIVTDEVEVERLSIYNRNVLANHPLNGARVKNTSGKHLLQGPITVLDANAYAGDARLNDVPPGQERLLSYGVDLQTRVNADKNETQNTILTGKIVKGVLQLTRKHVYTQHYVIDNKSEKDKTLIVEHPRQGGEWKLIETPEPTETTDQLYRFKTTIPTGKSQTFTVKSQLVAGEAIAILPAEIGQIQFYARTGEIPGDVREVLSTAIGMKQRMVDTQRQIDERTKQLAEITAEQGRIRENMKTVDNKSQYYTRLLAKLDEQETTIETYQKELKDLQKTLESQRKELETFLQDKTVG